MLIADPHEQMIEQQLRAWDVLDERVLEVFRKVPREHFVPPAHRFLACADLEIPLPEGQNMLRPSVAGRLLQSLELTGLDRVLEIGAGSGYLTACLAAASAHVQSLEIFPSLTALARSNLTSLGIGNALVSTADATRISEMASSAPSAMSYDAIAITASLPLADDRFQRHLNIGGRLFVVVGDRPVMEARLIRRTTQDSWTAESLFETVIDPLVNARRNERFRF